MYVPHTQNSTAQSLKWDKWLRVLTGSRRIFLFNIIPSLLLSWYREHTLITLLQIHLKFIMHVTLPEFPPYLPTYSFLCTEVTLPSSWPKNLLFTKLTTDTSFTLFWSYFRTHFYKHNMNWYFNIKVEVK